MTFRKFSYIALFFPNNYPTIWFVDLWHGKCICFYRICLCKSGKNEELFNHGIKVQKISHLFAELFGEKK